MRAQSLMGDSDATWHMAKNSEQRPPSSILCVPTSSNFWRLLICPLFLQLCPCEKWYKWSVWDWLLSLSMMPLRVIQVTGISIWACQVALVVKNTPANAGDARDTGSIPGSGRSPGVGNGNSLQSSCLGKSMDRGAWRATVHGGHKRVRHDWLSTTSILSRTYPVVWLYHSLFIHSLLDEHLDNFQCVAFLWEQNISLFQCQHPGEGLMGHMVSHRRRDWLPSTPTPSQARVPIENPGPPLTSRKEAKA